MVWEASSESSLSFMTTISAGLVFSSFGPLCASIVAFLVSTYSVTSSFTMMGFSLKKNSKVWLLSELSSSEAERGYLKFEIFWTCSFFYDLQGDQFRWRTWPRSHTYHTSCCIEKGLQLLHFGITRFEFIRKGVFIQKPIESDSRWIDKVSHWAPHLEMVEQRCEVNHPAFLF